MNSEDLNDHHRTEKYNYDTAVFRRGIPFVLKINKNESIESLGAVKISLELDGSENKRFYLQKENETNGWKYMINKDFSTITLYSPCSAAIGLYSICYSNDFKKNKLARFLLLFNPWFEGDDVFMKDEKLLSEYILATETCIYVGSCDWISAKNWRLDQFDSDSIRATVHLIHGIDYETRRNPVNVSRALSALINSNDDNGVISGNWTDDYGEGTNPLAWKGSGNILTEYITNKKSVKYGQCWVFSGLLCTVLRTIGIPVRCITNFASFHDSDGSLNWEVYVDEKLSVINKGKDSCWNFHCWNEAWMKRPDLGSKYDGWQVLDATPQERSGGLFRLGPASKFAIKNAKVKSDFDAGFVFAEVNAIKIFYKKQKDGTFKQYLVKNHEVGKKISTKMAGSNCREDITLEYKKSDDSAINRVLTPDLVEARTTEVERNRKISISFSLPPSVCLTNTLTGSVTVIGMCEDKKTTIKREISLVTYHGKFISMLFEDKIKCLDTENTFNFSLDPKKLSNEIRVEFPSIKFKVSVFDYNFDEYITEEKIVSVKTPDIEIVELQKNYLISLPIKFKVTVQNFLEKTMNNLRLNVEVTDCNPSEISIGILKPGDIVTRKVKFTAQSTGKKTITVTQVSNECNGFKTTETFNVSN